MLKTSIAFLWKFVYEVARAIVLLPFIFVLLALLFIVEGPHVHRWKNYMYKKRNNLFEFECRHALKLEGYETDCRFNAYEPCKPETCQYYSPTLKQRIKNLIK